MRYETRANTFSDHCHYVVTDDKLTIKNLTTTEVSVLNFEEIRDLYIGSYNNDFWLHIRTMRGEKLSIPSFHMEESGVKRTQRDEFENFVVRLVNLIDETPHFVKYYVGASMIVYSGAIFVGLLTICLGLLIAFGISVKGFSEFMMYTFGYLVFIVPGILFPLVKFIIRGPKVSCESHEFLELSFSE